MKTWASPPGASQVGGVVVFALEVDTADGIGEQIEQAQAVLGVGGKGLDDVPNGVGIPVERLNHWVDGSEESEGEVVGLVDAGAAVGFEEDVDGLAGAGFGGDADVGAAAVESAGELAVDAAEGFAAGANEGVDGFAGEVFGDLGFGFEPAGDVEAAPDLADGEVFPAFGGWSGGALAVAGDGGLPSVDGGLAGEDRVVYFVQSLAQLGEENGAFDFKVGHGVGSFQKSF